MATPPIIANMYEFARHVKYDYCNLLRIGDSISSQETDYRRPAGMAQAWRPNTWRGWTWPAGGMVSDTATAGSGGDPVGMVAPAYNEQWGLVNNRANHYDLAGRTWNQSQANTTYDSPTGTPYGTPLHTVSPGICPVTYREQQFSADPGANTLFSKISMRNTVLAKFFGPNTAANGNNPFANKIVNVRLFGYKNVNGITVRIFPNPSGAVVPINFNGAAGYVMGESTFPAAAAATLQLLLYTQTGASGITPGTSCFTLFGSRWCTNDTTGLLPAFWANSGWNTTTFADTALVSDANLEMWISMVLGNGLGAASPSSTNGPSAIHWNIGENLTAGEQAELDVGVSTTFKANYRAAIARVLARCANLGVGRPRMLFEAPRQTVKTPANGYAANWVASLAISQAVYELSQEYGGAYIDGYQLHPPVAGALTGRLGSVAGLDERLRPDGIHPQYQGALAEETAIWGAFEVGLLPTFKGLRGGY